MAIIKRSYEHGEYRIIGDVLKAGSHFPFYVYINQSINQSIRFYFRQKKSIVGLHR